MSIQTKLANFALVTVMKPTFYESNNGFKGDDALFTLDSLRISNFTQEGPTKTAKGGYNGNTILRYGKTMRLEMEDVIGKAAALTSLMGVVYSSTGPTTHKESFVATAGQEDFTVSLVATSVTLVQKNDIDLTVGTGAGQYSVAGSTISLVTPTTAGDIIEITYVAAAGDGEHYTVTDKFASAKYIEGTTYVIDPATGTKQWIKISIPMFLPDSLWNMTMEAEGDFGVMSIAGEIQANDCGEFFFFGDEPNHNC